MELLLGVESDDSNDHIKVRRKVFWIEQTLALSGVRGIDKVGRKPIKDRTRKIEGKNTE